MSIINDDLRRELVSLVAVNRQAASDTLAELILVRIARAEVGQTRLESSLLEGIAKEADIMVDQVHAVRNGLHPAALPAVTVLLDAITTMARAIRRIARHQP